MCLKRNIDFSACRAAPQWWIIPHLVWDLQLWLVSFPPRACLDFVLYSFLLPLCLFLFHISRWMTQPSPLPRLKLCCTADCCLVMTQRNQTVAGWSERNDGFTVSLNFTLSLFSGDNEGCEFVISSARRTCEQHHRNRDKYIIRQSVAKVGAITCHHSDFRFPSGYSGCSVTLIHLRSALRQECRGWGGTDIKSCHFVSGVVSFCSVWCRAVACVLVLFLLLDAMNNIWKWCKVLKEPQVTRVRFLELLNHVELKTEWDLKIAYHLIVT